MGDDELLRTTDTQKQEHGWSVIMQQKALYTVIGLLVALLGWLGSVNYTKLMEIEHSIAELKIEVARLQMSIIDEAKVKEIAKGVLEHELLQRGIP